jgi:serine/threonine protein kinase
LKIIDFGSGFFFGKNNLLTITTPEYLSPEFLGLFCGRKNVNNDQKNEFLKKKCLPWSIDVWSLGVNILEALVGIPIWMSFKCKKMHKGKAVFTTGFFAATGNFFLG